MNDPSGQPSKRRKRSIFLPLVLVAGVVALSLLNDVYQRFQRMAVLQERVDGLENAVADANRVRQQFDTLAKGVAVLADGGNANARVILAQLNKAGVKVDLDR